MSTDAQIGLAYEALSADAAIWESVSARMTNARQSVQGIDVYRGAFSFAGTAAADVYLEARDVVLQLLADAATQTMGAATALRRIRADFAEHEAQTQAELAGIWDVK